MNSCDALLSMAVDRDVMIALIRNKKKLKEATAEYQKAHASLVERHTITGDDGQPVYPTVEDPETGEQVEDRSGDPLFDDKQALVNKLNDLLTTDADIDGVKKISVYDLPDNEEALGVHAEVLSFMISDLYEDD